MVPAPHGQVVRTANGGAVMDSEGAGVVVQRGLLGRGEMGRVGAGEGLGNGVCGFWVPRKVLG